jgi:hypothetical protein
MKRYYKLECDVNVENIYKADMPTSNIVYLNFQAFYTKKREIAKKHIKGLQAFIDSKPSLSELMQLGIVIDPTWHDGICWESVSGSFFTESQLKTRIVGELA